jgi:hypothetical protein
MSDNEKRTKPKYESPTVVALGGIAKGSGLDCSPGSSANVDCTNFGVAALNDCTNGTNALNACTTVGHSATVACSAGEALP